jgi:hypothetical protein
VAITRFVERGVDGGYRVTVLDSDIDAGAVSGRPDAVRQITDRNGRELLEIGGPNRLDLVQSADRDIGDLAGRCWTILTWLVIGPVSMTRST